MVSPKQLAARGVPVHRLVHEEGSFVVTFPNAFHSGFNTGAPTFGRPHGVRCSCCMEQQPLQRLSARACVLDRPWDWYRQHCFGCHAAQGSTARRR